MRSGPLRPSRRAARLRLAAVLLLPVISALQLLPMSVRAAGSPGQFVNASGDVEWTRQFGTTRYDLAWATATSKDGGVYVAGFTNFALEGQHYHHRYDAFVRAYDANGNERWTRQFGSAGVDQVLAIAADEAGVTVVGSTDARLPKQQSAGGVDVLLARFGSSGRPLWTRQFGTKQDDEATAVAIGANGAFVAGTTGGALGVRRGGASDAFVAHLDGEGSVRWLRQFGTRGTDAATGVSIRAGRLYTVGWSTHSFRGPYLGGGADAFAAAFDRGGEPLWRWGFGSAGTDRGTAVAARADGLFVSGSTDGTLPDQTAAGGLDAFVAKLDPVGAPAWLRQFGSPADDEAVAVAANENGVFVAGSASGDLPDGALLGEWDGFVRRYLPDGTQIWTRQLGTTDYDRVYGLASEGTGLYLAGTTHGAFEGHTNAGDRDVFVVRVSVS